MKKEEIYSRVEKIPTYIDTYIQQTLKKGEPKTLIRTEHAQ